MCACVCRVGVVAEREACSAAGRIQVMPQQGLSGDSGCLPFIIGADYPGSLVKEMGKLRP